MMSIKVFLILLAAELFGVAGQVLYKKGVVKIGTPNFRDIRSCVNFACKLLFVPEITAGFVSIVMGLIVWLMVLAQADLTIAYPIGSVQYILTLAAAHFFLDEKINRLKLIGTLLVMVGIALVSVS